MTQSKTFCIAPFAGLQINSNGTLSPCCEFDHSAAGFDRVPTFRDYNSWQSVSMRQLKHDVLNGIKSPGCHKCWERESMDSQKETDVDSQRTVLNGIFKDFINTDFNPTRVESPRSLTVMFGNFCNLRCIQCNAFASSSHQTEQLLNKDAFKNLGLYSVDEFSDRKWWQTEEFSELLDKVNKNVDHIFLHGGEPLITPEAVTFLKSILNPGRLVLSITTNGTTLSDDVYDLLSRFKELNITVSLEGIGAHNDYLRYGSNWLTVRNNISRLQQLKNLSFGRVSINHILQHTSRHSLLPLLEFCHVNELMLIVGNLHEAAHLSINGMPPDQHQQFLAELTAAREIYTYYSQSAKAVAYTLHFLNTYQYDAVTNEKFYKYINMIDAIRGTSYFEVFGELDK